MRTASVQKHTPEARSFVRRNTIGPDLVPLEAGCNAIAGLMLNLGAGGAAMQLLGALQPAARHPLRWRLSPQEPWIEAQGELVWSGADNTCGVRFVDLPQDTLDRIASWVTRPESFIDDSAAAVRHDTTASLEDERTRDLTNLAYALLNADGALFAVLNAGTFVCVSSAGNAPPPGSVLQPEALLCSACLENQRIVQCTDVITDPLHRGGNSVSACASMLLAPVMSSGRAIGVIECRWKRRHCIESRDVLTLSSIADVSTPAASSTGKAASGQPTTTEPWCPQPISSAAGPAADENPAKPWLQPINTARYRSLFLKPLIMALTVVAIIACLALSFAAGWYGHNWNQQKTPLVHNTSSPAASAAPDEAERANLFRNATGRTPSDEIAPSRVQAAPPAAGRRAESSHPLRLMNTPVKAVHTPAARIHPSDTSAEPPVLRFSDLRSTSDSLHSIVSSGIPKLQKPTPAEALTSTASGEKESGPNVIEAVAIRRTPPMFPAAARSLRRSGLVILDAVVDAKGKVSAIDVVNGDPLLAAAAREAVSTWLYQPKQVDGRKVESTVRIFVRFQL